MTELECLPFGAGTAGEGIALLLRMGPHRILLDCGLVDLDPLLAQSEEAIADWVLCGHAHPDHARGLLSLNRALPELPIYASEGTAQLLPLNWLDEGTVPSFCQPLPWRSPIPLSPTVTTQLFPAGHLPGAAAFLLTYTAPQRTYKVFYTGDFLLSNSRLVEGLPLEELRGLKPDVLIIEGSYGTARHPHRRQQENQLAERMLAAMSPKADVEGNSEPRSILFPVPTLGLGQELLMLLRSHHQFTGRNLDVWVDGSVADGCDAYLELLPQLPGSVQNFARHQPLFWDDRVRPRVRRLPTDPGLRQIALSGQSPCILLTDKSTDLSRYLAFSRLPWLVLLPEQPGSGGESNEVERSLHTNAALVSALQSGQLTSDRYLLAEHCDGLGTTQLIHNLRPQHVVFIHGAPNYLADLAGLEELQSRYQLHIASVGRRLELPIGEVFIQPAAPETRYEGELTEHEDIVQILLPEAVMADPRWQNFSETGIVEARWQGEELVIKGVSPRALLNRTAEGAFGSAASQRIAPDTECCENCAFYRVQRCSNPDSSLYGFRVTPEGYCPAFEPVPPDPAENV